MDKSAPYAAFGARLADLRAQAGFDKQKELASALGVAQQSVSRWEKGLGRPRFEDTRKLERMVGAKDDELLLAAGYTVEQASLEVGETASSRDKPLPLSALAPETFESFCAALLDRRYRTSGGRVTRYGGAGHAQKGIDILATGPFGTDSFQCKRVTEFGAQKVHTVVAKQSFAADKKVLLLSCVASPSARDAMATHKGWELWDREDITRELHKLPMDDRLDLVDQYFSGQRFDLLGIQEPGPFQTAEAFFKPFLVPGRLFNHAWPIVGLEDDLANALLAVKDKAVILTCIVGNAGSGKSRFLRALATQLSEQEPQLRVRFVSPTEEVKSHHLDLLRESTGVGNGDAPGTLLVVDDAHEREDVGLLMRYAAVPENRTRLLMAVRGYGRESLRLQAAGVGLMGTLTRFIELRKQTQADALALAETVLKATGGPITAAAEIAKATYTTPLVTVMAAQLVSRDDVPVPLLNNADELKTYVLSRLQDVLAVTLVTGQDTEKLRGVLRVAALVQPVIPDDPSFLRLLSSLEGVEAADAGRLMRLLIEAGVLFKRGLRTRIAPDLLADEILRSNYIDAAGSANTAVLRAFDGTDANQLKNLLVNLGRLDWRIREGDTSDSALLAGIEPRLSWGEQYSHPHVDAVEAVAYYQPRFALSFARRLIDEGHGDTAGVCNIVRNAAYTYDHLEEACKLLWRAGRQDSRQLNSNPSHGIRILKELANFKPNKPIAYVRSVVDFALALLERPASLQGSYTPFHVLEGALETEMQSSSFSRNEVTFTRYQLPLKLVMPIRRLITHSLLRYLTEDPPQRALLAARSLGHALRGPMHGDTPEGDWQNEHHLILLELRKALESHLIPAVVLVEVAKSVRWHAFHGFESNAVEAKAILELLARDLRTRLVRTLVDGWGTETWKLGRLNEREEHIHARAALVKDLSATFSTPAQIIEELQAALEEIATIAGERHGMPIIFVNHLLSTLKGLPEVLLQQHLQGKAGRLTPYVGKALGEALAAGDAEFIRSYFARSETSAQALVQLAEAYVNFEPSRPYTSSEIELFQRIVLSDSKEVQFVVPSLVRQVGHRSPGLALDLICSYTFDSAEQQVHDFFMWLSSDTIVPEGELSPRRGRLLQKLIDLQGLDDYWITAFLRASLKHDPTAVMDLVKQRLLESAARNDWKYQPLERDHQGNGLGLLELEAGPALLRGLLDWALEGPDRSRIPRDFAEAVAGLCGKYDTAFLEVLLDWMSHGTPAHAALTADILTQAPRDLVIESPGFVRDVLNSAEVFGEKAVATLRSALTVAAESGAKSGAPGEPFPEDLRMEAHCLQMLSKLSRVEPAYELYAELLRSARYGIARQRRAKEAMEDEDE
jgi:transcriptional regulator with XRE-family HTH domain